MRILPVIPDVGPQAPFLTTAAPVSFDAGFYDAEQEGLEPFRWMGMQGVLRFEPDDAPRYLELWVLSEFHDLSQHLTLAAGDDPERLELAHGWAPLSMPVPAHADHVRLDVNKSFPRAYYTNDRRTLAIRVRAPRLHRDAERHAHIARQYRNLARNTAETLAGKTVLDSTPPSLGIDLHGACNVKPPCVYCEWDYSKNLEQDNVDVPFTRETLEEWGPFFDNSVNLINCSIGEPFMMRNLDELFDIFGTTGKVLEMTTNGQILTDRNIQKLVGRNVDLYISLDAATPETYRRLRNDTFDKILNNLRRLIAAKGGRAGLPRIHLVFMPMRANVHELDAFVHLCADLHVDRLVLRPLNYSDSIDLDWKRAGYHYQYKNELLPWQELVRVSGRAAHLCQALGVPLADQMDFGGSMKTLFADTFDEGRKDVVGVSGHAPVGVAPIEESRVSSLESQVESREPVASGLSRTLEDAAPLPSLGAEKQPACLEPWKSLYILRRGVLPCCYGGKPIAPMQEYREAWNSPLMQGIRGELLQGRFHDYCLRSPACPIIQKSEHAGQLPMRQALRMKVRHVWGRFNRATGGRANDVWQGVKWVGIRARRIVTEPRYVIHHTKRIFGLTHGSR